MNNELARIIFLAGSRLRGTPVMRYVQELEESQWWSGDEIREAQLRKLRALLLHANEHSPFYRERFARHGFDCAIGSLNDLKALPSIGKKEILAHRDEIQNAGLRGKLIFSKTAGTTSVPLRFYRTQDWDAQHRAAIARGCRWYGVDPWMRGGQLWSIPPRAVDRARSRAEDFLLNRFREKRMDLGADTLEAFYGKLAKARYLSGYSSMIYELARHVNERHPGQPRLQLALVKATSEKILPHYREAVRDAFGAKMTGEYGAAETGIIGFDCPAGSCHVNMDHVIVEIEQDEIIATNLISHSFPFIRYRLGDYIRLKEGFTCPCGRKGLIIEDIMGRVGLRVYGRAGTVFPSIAVDQIIKRLVEVGDLVAQCQAIQRVEGMLEFHVVPAKPLGADSRSRIEEFFSEMVPRFFRDDIEYRLVFTDAIPRGEGKFLEFVSELPRRD